MSHSNEIESLNLNENDKCVNCMFSVIKKGTAQTIRFLNKQKFEWNGSTVLHKWCKSYPKGIREAL